MGWAATAQANMIQLVSGAKVILNFLKKLMPRMGPATAACKKTGSKSLPWNLRVFVMNPQDGIGNPFAPWRRGPDRWHLMHMEQCSMLLQCQPNTCR
jgi:hypothetical protein